MQNAHKTFITGLVTVRKVCDVPASAKLRKYIHMYIYIVKQINIHCKSGKLSPKDLHVPSTSAFAKTLPVKLYDELKKNFTAN